MLPCAGFMVGAAVWGGIQQVPSEAVGISGNACFTTSTPEETRKEHSGHGTDESNKPRPTQGINIATPGNEAEKDTLRLMMV